jgi:hypothetical protein
MRSMLIDPLHGINFLLLKIIITIIPIRAGNLKLNILFTFFIYFFFFCGVAIDHALRKQCENRNIVIQYYEIFIER